jgi:predicted DNA-binding transcriptional regulator AlpA
MNHYTLEYKLSLPMQNRLLTAKEVSLRIGKSVGWIYKYEKLSQFPSPIKINSRNVLWQGEEIETWISNLNQNKGAF